MSVPSSVTPAPSAASQMYQSAERLVSWIGLALAVASITYFRSRHLDIDAALNGFSPEQVAVTTNHPEWFGNNFPSGALDTLKSIVFQVYPLAEAAGLSITSVWACMIGLEVATFALAAMFAFSLLFPAAPLSMAASAGILYAGSSLVSPDLAQFAFPYYGWVYGFAHAGLLVAVALFLRDRLLGAAVALVVVFMVHPINAIFTATFCAGAMAARIHAERRLAWKRLVLPIIIALAGCGAWFAWISSHGTISGGDVPPDLFVALTRAQNYHWFPFYLGVFWQYHANTLLPLLSSIALLAWALGVHAQTDRAMARQVGTGVAALLIVCATGLYISEFVQIPTLIKLSLHRAGQPAVTIGSLFILHALWLDLTRGKLPERGLGALLLLLPFQSPVGLVPFPVALRVGLAAYRATTSRSWSLGLVVACLFLALTAGFIVYFRNVGLIPDLTAIRYSGMSLPLAVAAVLAMVWPLLWADTTAASAATRAAVVVGALSILAMIGSKRFDLVGETSLRQKGQSALEAQLWARANTPVGSLFMVDPTLGYMWRDKSHRPSFGTVREWLLLSMMYNSRRTVLDEGIRRYNALGVPFPDYIFKPAERSMPRMLSRIVQDASDRFSAFKTDDFRRLNRDFGVQYIVFQKTLLKGPVPIPVVHENAHFVIGKID